MNAGYDHIVAIVLVGAIFVGTVVAMPAAMSYNTFEAVDQQQLKNITLNTFNAMLLGTGSPSNWGSQFPFNQANVNGFGLSSSIPFSTYVLDSDKVQRIDPESVGYINYSRTLELLKLQGYGFKFSLYRPFKVDSDIQWDETNLVSLSVNVTRTEDGTPIPNAVVKANLIATATNMTDKYNPGLIASEISHSTTTDVLGRAEISEQLTVPSGYTLDKAIAVMHIIVSGMDTMVLASKDRKATDCLKISTFEDTVTLSFHDQEYYNVTNTPNGERKIKFMYGYDLESLMLLHTGGKGNDDVVTQGSGYDNWTMTFPGLSSIDPAMLVFIVSVPVVDQGGQENGRQLVMLAGPYAFTSSNKIFQYGPGNPPGKVLSTMRRLVLISGMTYVSELIVWKE
jgi:hypothetical protein